MQILEHTGILNSVRACLPLRAIQRRTRLSNMGCEHHSNELQPDSPFQGSCHSCCRFDYWLDALLYLVHKVQGPQVRQNVQTRCYSKVILSSVHTCFADYSRIQESAL